MDVLKDWIIPIAGLILAVASIGIAIAYSNAAKADADRAQRVLDSVNEAVATWQREIVQSTISILNSTPQVIQGKMAEERAKAAHQILASLSGLISGLSNANPNAYSPERLETIKSTFENLRSLLSEFK
jgi:uncharacterized membrane-anchored protein YhcB (DUF1043 family)